MDDFYGLNMAELEKWLARNKEPAYRAKQIFEWAYQHAADSFDAMSNLPTALRHSLENAFELGPLPIARSTKSGDTTKLLLELADKKTVECVRIAMRKSDTACVSSQIGCVVKCAFCATGQMSCERNLTSGEIVRQVISLTAAGARVGNIVLMGMGEPFHNYEAVVAAVRRFVDPLAFGLSPSRVTVSTSGVAPMIRQYAKEGLATELAVSLNAPTDVLRKRLMPGVSKWRIEEILDACAEFSAAHSGQPVTFAYVLIEGVNDDLDQAEALARLLRGRPHHLNLIPLNRVAHASFKTPSGGRIEAFQGKLRAMHVNVSVRRSKGEGIEAACGQLKAG